MPAFKNTSNGTWYVQFRYTDWTGERKQKLKRGFPTKREAMAWEREFLMQKKANLDMTFGKSQVEKAIERVREKDNEDRRECERKRERETSRQTGIKCQNYIVIIRDVITIYVIISSKDVYHKIQNNGLRRYQKVDSKQTGI